MIVYRYCFVVVLTFVSYNSFLCFVRCGLLRVDVYDYLFS